MRIIESTTQHPYPTWGFVNHNHILRTDTPGCPACDWAAGRPPINITFHHRTPTVYPQIPETVFNNQSTTVDSVTLVESSEGEYIFVYGAADPQKVAEATTTLYKDVYQVPEVVFEADHNVRVKNVVALTPPGDDEWVISWADKYQNHPDSFPVTIVDVDGWV